MAFWGVFVQPGQPYTLKLEGGNKRLRISHATLGERIGIWKSRSILQCAVGSKPPVYICSVSNDLPSCTLDLEFEESEDVVFSTKGARGIHLCGYYITSHAAERATTTVTNDLKINCNGIEEISKAENEKERKLVEEEEDVGKTRNFAVGGEDDFCNRNDGGHDVGNIGGFAVGDEDNSCNDGGNDVGKSTYTVGAEDNSCDRNDCGDDVGKTGTCTVAGEDNSCNRNAGDDVGKTGSFAMGSEDNSCNRNEGGDDIGKNSSFAVGGDDVGKTGSFAVGGEDNSCNKNDVGKTSSFAEGAEDRNDGGEDVGKTGSFAVGGEDNSCNKNDIGKTSSFAEGAEDRNDGGDDVGKTGSFAAGGEDNSCGRNDGGDDVLIDACNVVVNTVLQELNATADEDLVNNIEQQEISCVADTFSGMADERVSCARESNISATEVIIEDGCDADDVTSPPNNTLDTGIGSTGKADPLNRLGEHESEEQIKEIVEGCSKLGTLDADVGDFQNIELEPDEALQARSETNGTCQEEARNQQNQESRVNMVVGVPRTMLPDHEDSSEVGQKSKERRKYDDWKDVPRKENRKPTNDKFSNGVGEEVACPNNLVQSSDIRSERSKKTKKGKKTKVSKRKSLGKDTASFDNVQERIQQRVAINGNMVQVLPEDSKQKPACDKGNDIYSHKKKKQKIKGDENLRAKSSQIRTSSKDLIIEELAAGEADGEVAAPGKKVKIFYTARLRDTGCIVESNVGVAPFKFRIGDEKIIKGWNIGVDGMRVGEKRRLTIPPSMGYGKRFLEVIPRDAWLVCDIELVSVR